jgi:flagellar hook-basal body complex protein FliE
MNKIRFGDVSPVRYTSLGKMYEPTPEGPSFADTLKSACGEVNELQLDGARQLERLTAGEDVDLHQVMVAAEEASLAFDLMMEIRNKLLEAYQEIQRMNV